MSKRWFVAVVLGAIAALSIGLSRLWPGCCDDAYISFVYVKNALSGHGLSFNGDMVQGYTNPLWVLLLAGLALLHVPPPMAAPVLGWLSGAGTLVATYWLARQLGLSRFWGLLSAGLVGVSVDFAYYLGKGMETPLFALLVTLTLGWSLAPGPGRRHAVAAGLAGGLAALCRLDGLLVAGSAAVILVARSRRIPLALIAAGLTALVLAPWMVFARVAYGDWLPNTYYAKAGYLSLLQMRRGLAYLLGVPPGITQAANGFRTSAGLPFSMAGAVLCFLLVSLFATMLSRGRPSGSRGEPSGSQRGSALGLLCGVILLWCGYVIAVGGDHLVGWRFLVPILPAMMVAVAAMATLPSQGGGLARGSALFSQVAIVLMPVALIGLRWADGDLRIRASAEQGAQLQRMAVGWWLLQEAPPHAVIALCPAGIIPYVSGLRVIDMLGLNDRHIAHFGHRDDSLPTGHQVGDGAYVLSRQPDYILFGAAGEKWESGVVSERELVADPRFLREYRPLTVVYEDWSFTIFARAAGPSTESLRLDSGQAGSPHAGASP